MDLIDLTESLMALGQSFKDYATATTGDPLPDNMRLYVREIRSGSVIADLITLADQAEWLLKHAEVLAGFVGNVQDIANFFLGKKHNLPEPPTQKQAKQIAQLLDPVAKDTGSQMNIQVSDGGTVNIIKASTSFP